MDSAWTFIKDGWAVLSGMVFLIVALSGFSIRHLARKEIARRLFKPDTGGLIYKTELICAEERDACQTRVCNQITESEKKLKGHIEAKDNLIMGKLEVIETQAKANVKFMGEMNRQRDEAKNGLEKKIDKIIDAITQLATQQSKVEGKFEQFQKALPKTIRSNGG